MGDLDKSQSLLTQLQEAKEALLEAKGEIQRLKAELLRMEVDGQKQGQDYEAKKLEFQREMMELSQKAMAPAALPGASLIDRQTSAIRQSMQDNNNSAFEVEKAEMHKKIRDLSRKVEELTDDVKMTEDANLDLKAEKSRLQLQLEELRTQLRTQLSKYSDEYAKDRQSLAHQAKEELLKTYNDKEREN